MIPIHGALCTMKSHTEHLNFNVPKRMDFVNITSHVEEALRKSGIREGLCTASLALWIPMAIPSVRHDRRRLAVYVVLGHLVLILGIAASLPRRYESQKDFNAKARQ